ncbi:MAG: four helix bundle protein, partial [Ferruginibacter sp.]|nr:four helix bundle protein [Ferruginibacter sp.]
MPTIKKFEELEVWQLARMLSSEIFEMTRTKPLSLDFALKDQMLRSAGSIMDNIAEGFGRGSRHEFVQFLSIAKASASELQSQLVRCKDNKYISDEGLEIIILKINKIGNKIAALMSYLNKSNFKGQKFMERSDNKSTPNPKYQRHEVQHQTPQSGTQTPNTRSVTPNPKHQTNKEIIKTNKAATPLGAY